MKITRLTIHQLAELLRSESKRGVICGSALIKLFAAGVLPKKIFDLMGQTRLEVERVTDELFEVRQYPSELADE